MPKEWRIPFAILAIILCVGVGIAATLSFTAPQNDPCAQYAKASEYDRHKSCVDSAATQSIAIYTQVLAYFTVILAIGTLGLGGIGLWQGSLARAEFNATHRPKIKILSVITGTSFDQKTKQASTTFITRYVNTGTSIATMKEFGSQTHPADPVGEIRFETDTLSYQLAPGEEDTHHFTPQRDAPLGKHYTGYVRYEDGAGRLRKTFFHWKENQMFCRWERVKGSPYDSSF